MVTGQLLMLSTQYPWLVPSLSILGTVKLFCLLKGNWHLRAILACFVQMEPESQRGTERQGTSISQKRCHWCLLTKSQRIYTAGRKHMLLIGSVAPLPLLCQEQTWFPFEYIVSRPLSRIWFFQQPKEPVLFLSKNKACHSNTIPKMK